MERFADWIKKPYSEDMSAGGWFLFLGLLIVLSVVWSLILRSLKEISPT